MRAIALSVVLLVACAAADDPAPGKPDPEELRAQAGYASISPNLGVADAAKAIDWYVKVLGAKERFRVPDPETGRIMHAELQLGDSVVMIHDPVPTDALVGAAPPADGVVGVSLYTFVADPDAVYKRAMDAGATSVMEVADQHWGDRYGSFRDPFGHVWGVARKDKGFGEGADGGAEQPAAEPAAPDAPIR